MNQQPANTAQASKIKRTGLWYYALFLLLAGVYSVGSILSPIRDNAYGLTSSSVRALQVGIIAPVLIIWFLAVFGAVRFKAYATKIKSYDDGKAMNGLANGLLLLSFGTIVSILASVPRNYVDLNGTDYRTLTVASNYLSILIVGVVFITMYAGSQKLLKLVKRSAEASVARLRLTATMLAVLLAPTYAVLVFTNASRNGTNDPLSHSSFYLNDVALMLTIVLPTVLVWALGLQVLVSLRTYQSSVRGSTYRQVFKLLGIGLSIVLSFYIILSLLTSLGGFMSGASLSLVLVFIYAVLACYGAGFVVIARGANKLSKLEEV